MYFALLVNDLKLLETRVALELFRTDGLNDREAPLQPVLRSCAAWNKLRPALARYVHRRTRAGAQTLIREPRCQSISIAPPGARVRFRVESGNFGRCMIVDLREWRGLMVRTSSFRVRSMPQLVQMARWVGAVPLFLLCSIIGLTIGVSAATTVGVHDPYNYVVGFACATVCGALAGTLAAPSGHRKLATRLFPGVIVAYTVYSIVAQYPSSGIPFKQQLNLLGAVAGSGLVYIAARSAFPDHNRTGDHQVNTARVVIQWLVALLLAALTFFTTYLAALLLDQKFGGVSVSESIWATIVATMTGVTAGVIIVPSSHRPLGFWVFVAAAILVSLPSIITPAIHGQLHAADFLDLVGCICGSLLIWRPLRGLRHQQGGVL